MLKMDDSEKLKVLVDAELGKIAKFILTRSKENIVRMKAINTGQLRRSGMVRKNPMGQGWSVGYTAPYSTYVEMGSRAHRPPVEPILMWVRRKLKKTGKEAKSIAYAICNKIAKEGTTAKPFFREALDEVRAKGWVR